MKLVVLK